MPRLLRFIHAVLMLATSLVVAAGSPFQGAAIGCEWVEVGNSGVIGSFDSRDDIFRGGSVGSSGHVRTLTQTSKIDLSGSPTMYGDIFSAGAIETSGGGTYNGSVLHATKDVTLGSGGTTLDFDIRAAGNLSFTSDTVVDGDVAVNGGIEFRNYNAQVLGDTEYGGVIQVRASEAHHFPNSSPTPASPGVSNVATEACDPLGLEEIELDLQGLPGSAGPSIRSAYPYDAWVISAKAGIRYFDESTSSYIYDDKWETWPKHSLDTFGDTYNVIRTGSIDISGDGSLRIEDGNVILYVEGDFRLHPGDGDGLEIDDDASLIVFVTGKTSISSVEEIEGGRAVSEGETRLPRFGIFSLDRSTERWSPGVFTNDPSKVPVAIYAPWTYAEIKGEVYGAVRAKRVYVTGHGDIYFDAALANLDMNCSECELDLELPGVTLLGTVYNDRNLSDSYEPETGEALEDSDVSFVLKLVEVGGDQIEETTASADTGGEFEFTGIERGTYRLFVENVDVLKAAGWFPATPSPPTIEITVENDDVVDLDFGFYVGVSVSGIVYYDRNADGFHAEGEAWKDDVNVVVRLLGASPDVPPFEVQEGGHFFFDGIQPGRYEVAVTEATATNAPPAEWLFVEPDDGTLDIEVESSDVEGLALGLFRGSRVIGSVFRDDGARRGTANDAVRDGGEHGLSDIFVEAIDSNPDPDSGFDGSPRRTRTSADGTFELYLPGAWNAPIVRHERRPATGVSLRNPDEGTAQVVRAATEFDDADAATWAPSDSGPGTSWSLGRTFAWVDFGTVERSTFGPDQNGQTTSPGAALYSHRFRPGTLGTLELVAEGGRSYAFLADEACTGSSASTRSDGAVTIDVTDAWRNTDGTFESCSVDVRVLVPAGEPAGRIDIATLNASLVWSGTAAGVEVVDEASLVDVTTVVDRQGLALDMTVDGGEGAVTRGEGRPQDLLEYCVRYSNVGVQRMEDVVIRLPIPFHTRLVRNAYSGGGDMAWRHLGGTGVLLSQEDDEDEADVDGHLATLRLPDPLEPAQHGSLCLKARIR